MHNVCRKSGDLRNVRDGWVIDVKACDSSMKCTFFEFKSVESLPPGNFTEQLLKDLQNPDITDLSKMPWIFDGQKLKNKGIDEATFKADMKVAIMDTLGTLTQDKIKELYDKFSPDMRNVEALANKIVAESMMYKN